METTATHPRTAAKAPHSRRLSKRNGEARWVLDRDKPGVRGGLGDGGKDCPVVGATLIVEAPG
jgi:hypothetical protein